MLTDLQRLQRYACHGDAHAFRELVHAHGPMVYASALRVTQNAAVAEDVAQETFLELARKAGDITQSVAAWLHRVAWIQACQAVRRESTRKRVEEAMAETWHTDREATWPDIEPHVDASLNELPNELREVLVLYFLEGRTQAEVARHLGKNQATVSRAIERGISAMREALRSRGVIAGAGLAALFTAQSAQAMPVAVQASLGKVAIANIKRPAPAASLSVASAGAVVVAVLCLGTLIYWRGNQAASTLPPDRSATSKTPLPPANESRVSSPPPTRPLSRAEQNARRQRVSLAMTNASLGDALDYLGRLSGIELMADESIRRQSMTDLDMQDVSVQEVLQHLSIRYHLDIRYEDDEVHIEAAD